METIAQFLHWIEAAADIKDILFLAGGGVGGALGTLIFGLRYRQRLKALESRQDPPATTIYNFNGNVGAVYVDSDGMQRLPFEGEGEIASPVPVKVIPLRAEFKEGVAVGESFHVALEHIKKADDDR